MTILQIAAVVVGVLLVLCALTTSAYFLGRSHGFNDGWDAYGQKLVDAVMREPEEPQE